jgi:tetratricopeptide (TPR) repeat protein
MATKESAEHAEHRGIETLADLAAALRRLRRQHARNSGDSPLTYRELAAKTGWALGAVGEYFSGRRLPPTDRFDVLLGLLGASPAEQGALATARDRVEERRRRQKAPAAADKPPAPSPAWPSPAQLPLDAPGFAGRESELAALDAVHADGARDRTAGAVVTVSGTAGVGKTALAVRWAHRVADRFPDGQLFVNLRGYDCEQPVPAADVLAGFLRALGVPACDIPLDPQERAAGYRTALSRRRVLIVLDNAGSAEQVRPLLPGTPSCMVLVTSRGSLAGLVALDGARRVEVDLLPEAAAVGLLRRLVDRPAETDPAILRTLAGFCARLPLALRVAAELVNARAATPLPALVAELADARRRLDLLRSDGDARGDVRAVLSWSYQYLPADAATAFRLLSVHPGLDHDAYAAAAVLGADLGVARGLVEGLLRSHLVHRSDAGRYGMHDVLRAYAADLSAATDSEPAREAAQRRLVDYYLAVAATAMDLVHPAGRHRRPPGRPPETAVPALRDRDAALAWLDTERDNLVGISALAARWGWAARASALGRTLYRYLDVGGHHDAALAIHEHAYDAARRAGDLGGQAHALTSRGALYVRLGRYACAAADYALALALHRTAGDRAGEAHVLLDLGSLAGRQGDYGSAAEHLHAAHGVYREIDDRVGAGSALTNLGLVHEYTGSYQAAAEHHERALALLRGTADRVGLAHALANLAAALMRQGRYDRSARQYQEAIAVFGEIGDRCGQADANNGLAENLASAGRTDVARTRHTTALALAVRAGDRYEQARAHRGLGDLDRGGGRVEAAQRHWHQALLLFTELGVPDAAGVRNRLSMPAMP